MLLHAYLKLFQSLLVSVMSLDHSSSLCLTRAGKRFTVLLLCEKGAEGLEHPDFKALEPPDVLDTHFWQGSISLSLPDEVSFTVMDVPQDCLYGISCTSLNLDAKKVLDDFKRRQIPRFR